MVFRAVIFLGMLLGTAVCAASPAYAALFCVQVSGIPPQCIYDDAAACRQRALQLQGICGLNPDQMTLQPGYGQYCLVNSQRSVECVFPDRNSCESEAARNGAAVCVENTLAGVQLGPYRYDPHRPY